MRPDAVTAKSSDAKYRPHPEGQFTAQCVDCIALGEAVMDFPGADKYLTQKCALVFRTGEVNEETGEVIDISQEFTVSMGERANLRKFLEQWRGKSYTSDQVEQGVPLDKLVGNYALVTVSHRKSGKGRTYANIQAIVGVPKQMQGNLPKFTDYKRAEFWVERKKSNAEAAKVFREEIGAPLADFDDAPHLHEDDDSLPF